MHILVAQDPAVMSPVLEACAGHQVDKATTVSQAKDLLAQNVYDAIIVGVHFDESRAMELIAWLRQERPNMPIVMVRLKHSDFEETFRRTARALKKVGSICSYLELEGDKGWREKIQKALRKCVDLEISLSDAH